MTGTEIREAVARLVEAGEKATPGEWSVTKYAIIAPDQLVAPNPGCRDEGDGIDSDDADFMCAAANARPALSALAGMCVLPVEVVRHITGAASMGVRTGCNCEDCAPINAAIAAAEGELAKVEEQGS